MNKNSHPISHSMKVWLTFLGHCLTYALGLSFVAACLMFVGYLLNFYGLSDALLAWSSALFFASLFVASFFALHQALGRYVSSTSLQEVLQEKTRPLQERTPSESE